jgi:hypothetical protein
MRRWLFALMVITTSALRAQDSDRVAPAAKLEILLGVSFGEQDRVEARTAPDRTQSMNLHNWAVLALGFEGRVKGPWSARLLGGFAIGGWNSTGGGPTGGGQHEGERWHAEPGVSYLLHGGERNFFTASATACTSLGMRIAVEYWMTPYYNTAPVPPVIEHYEFHYRTSISPRLEVAWHHKGRKNALGFALRTGVEYFHYRNSTTELPDGRDAVPSDLAAFLGTHDGWAWSLSFGLVGIP